MLIKLDHSFLCRLTDTEKNVINFINQNGNNITNMSISDVAEATYSSPATVSRTIKKCGISGFAELRYMISQRTNQKQDLSDVNEIMQKSLTEVNNTLDRLSIDSILKIIKEINSSQQIYIFARGLSEQVAAEFSLKLQVLGHPVICNYDKNMIQEISRSLKKNSLVFFFSMSGSTPELIVAAENASSQGAHIVTCTCVNDTPLEKLAHVALIGYSHKYRLSKLDLVSRLPLFVMSRVVIDYLLLLKQQDEAKAEAKEKARRSKKMRI